MSKTYSIVDAVFLAQVDVTTGKKHKHEYFDCYVESGELPGHYHLHLDDRRDFYGLIHECLHLVRRILRDRNIEPDEELVAYYQTYLFKTIWRQVGKEHKT